MLEEERHTLAVVGTSACLGKLQCGQQSASSDITHMCTYGGTDVDRLNAVADLLLCLVGYCVRHNDLLQSAAVQRLNGVAAQNTVGDDRDSVLCSALVDQDTCGFDKSTTSICHIIDKNGSLAGHFSNQSHSRDLVWTSALFVNKREGQVQTIGDRRRPALLSAPNVQS